MDLDTSKISNVAIEGINHRDAPDYCDAVIASADILENGVERDLTEKELDWLRDEEYDWFYSHL